jgi:hypothetical protein
MQAAVSRRITVCPWVELKTGPFAIKACLAGPVQGRSFMLFTLLALPLLSTGSLVLTLSACFAGRPAGQHSWFICRRRVDLSSLFKLGPRAAVPVPQVPTSIAFTTGQEDQLPPVGKRPGCCPALCRAEPATAACSTVGLGRLLSCMLVINSNLILACTLIVKTSIIGQELARR